MATGIDIADVQQFLPAVVVLLKNVADSMVDCEESVMASDDDDATRAPLSHATKVHSALVDMNTIITSVLHDI
jgi:hypothetical protein